MKTTRALPLSGALMAAVMLAIAPRATAQDTLYGTTGGSAPGNLYTINPANGNATLVGALVDINNNAYAVTGIAFDSVTGVLYGSTSSLSPTAPAELITINPSSGLITVIGAFNTGSTGVGQSNGPETMADLTFDSANLTLYGGGSQTAYLYTINTATGAAATFGSPTFGPRGMGLAANNSGDTIYVTPNSTSGSLVEYDTSTAAHSTVAPLSGGPHQPNGLINALAFNSSSVLYGVDAELTNSPTKSGHLVTIDTASGVISDVGLTVDTLDAIDFMPVPEPGTWLIGVLSLGAILFVCVRRLARR
jgi:hypothetical protein